MTDSDGSETELRMMSSFPTEGLPIPVSALRRHVRACKQSRCFAHDMVGHGGVTMQADASSGGEQKHWLQLSLPRTRSVVYYPDEEAHEGHRGDRESILVTYANLRLTCSCFRPSCCLPSLLDRLCATYNCCAFDHDITQHKGHLSSDEARYRLIFGTYSMAPSKVKIVSSLLKAMGLVLALIIAGLAGYLIRPCPGRTTTIGGGVVAGTNDSAAPPQQPLTLSLDTGTLSGLEIILLCAILAVTLGALACLFKPTISHLIEQYLLDQSRLASPLLSLAHDDDLGGGGPEGIEHQLRPPSPSRVRLN